MLLYISAKNFAPLTIDFAPGRAYLWAERCIYVSVFADLFSTKPEKPLQQGLFIVSKFIFFFGGGGWI